MLILPLPSRVQPVLELPRGSFVVLGPVEGDSRRAAPLQKNQFVSASTLLFLLCWSRYVLFLLCWFSVVVFVVRILMQAPCHLLKCLKNQGFVIFVRVLQAEKSRVPVTGEPGGCYAGALR